MARITQPNVWLTMLYERIRSTPRRLLAYCTPSPHIDDSAPAERLWVTPSAAGKEYELMLDDDLVQLISVRNQEALSTLYARHGKLVFSLALHITGDQPRAEDITQDVFVYIWQQYSAFQSQDATVQSWIAAITRRRALETLQTRQGKRPVVAPNAGLMLVQRLEVQRDQQIVVHDRICEALISLPVTQRQAIELSYYGGLTVAEIAAVVHEPVNTIKSRLRTALTTLRKAVQSEVEVTQPVVPGEQRQRDASD